MLKKSITFDDLDGNSITEEFHFNFTKAELAEMKLSYDGGLETYLAEISKKENQSEVIPAFKMILRKTVGRRHEDGRQFIKSDALSDYFMQTEAYSELFMELLTNPGQMAKFIEGCMPKDLVAEAKKQGALAQLTGVSVVEDVPLDVVTVVENAIGSDIVIDGVRDFGPHDTGLGVIESVKKIISAEKPETALDFTEGELSGMPIEKFRDLVDAIPGNNIPKNIIAIAMRRAIESNK